MHQSSSFAGKELILYLLIFGSGGIIIYLLKSFFIREKISGLNSGRGSYGIALYEKLVRMFILDGMWQIKRQ